MLGKSFTSPVRSFEPSTLNCISSFDTAILAPNVSSMKLKLSHRLRPSVQIDEMTGIARLPVSASKKWKVSSTVETQSVSLGDEERKMWEACRELIVFNFSTEEKDKILGKAFGHVHSPYWGEEREKEVPRHEVVNDILNYLQSLGLSEDDLGKVLKKFPEVLGCKLEEELKKNVGILGETWGIKGKSLKNLLLRNPKVLGYVVDCKGDCIAKCTRCWVRF